MGGMILPLPEPLREGSSSSNGNFAPHFSHPPKNIGKAFALSDWLVASPQLPPQMLDLTLPEKSNIPNDSDFLSPVFNDQRKIEAEEKHLPCKRCLYIESKV